MNKPFDPPELRLARDVGEILAFGFGLAMLLPIVVTPFLGDDIFNSYVNGVIDYGHTTFWQFIRDLNITWIHNGRFFPGAFVESYGLFHIISALWAYKAFQLCITLLNVFTFYVLIRALRMSFAIGLIGTIFLVCTFQMRQYHDGLLGFSGNIEFITELTLLSLLGLLFYLRSGKPWAFIASLTSYAVGLFTYEVTYLLWLVFLAVLLVERPWRTALRLAVPYVSLSAIVIAVQLYVKATAHTRPDADYNIRLNAASFAVTFTKQAFAAFPLTYVVIDPSNLFAHGATVFASIPLWIIAGMFMLVATAAWVACSALSVAGVDRRAAHILISIGAIFWVTPAILVASTARYQRELVFGLGHVPVYIEYYGITMIALGLASCAILRWGSPGGAARLILCLGVGTIAIMTYASNACVIATSVPDKEGMQNMHAALRSGLMRDVPAGAELYVDASIAPNHYLDESDADAKYFYYLETGARVEVHSIGSLPHGPGCTNDCRVAANSYELINVAIDDAAGYTALGQIGAFATSKGQVRSFAHRIALFVRGIPTDQRLWIRYMKHGCGRDRLVARMLRPQAKSSVTTRIETQCGWIEMNTLGISVVPEGADV